MIECLICMNYGQPGQLITLHIVFEMLLLVGTICAISLLIVIVTSIFGDADFTTLFYEKYGKSLRGSLEKKVVWITGASTGK